MSTRVLVAIRPDGSVSVFADNAEVQVMVLKEAADDSGFADAAEQAGAVVPGLPQFDEERVAQAFEEGFLALEAAAGSSALPRAMRTQAAVALKAWR